MNQRGACIHSRFVAVPIAAPAHTIPRTRVAVRVGSSAADRGV